MRCFFVLGLIFFLSVNLTGQNTRKLYRIGKEMQEAGKFNDAIEQYSKALELAPGDDKFLELRAECYEKTDQNNLAFEDYQTLFEYNSRKEEYAYKAAINLFKQKEYRKGLDFTKKVLAQKSRHYDALLLQVDMLMALGNYERARVSAVRLIDLDKNPDSYYRAGVIDYKLGNYKSSEIFLRKTLNLQPRNVDAIIWLARALDKREKYTIARGQLAAAIKIDPRNVEIYHVKSLINEHTMLFRDAIDDMSRVLTINPENVDAYYRRAKLYLKVNDKDKAVNDLKSIIEIQPESYKAYEMLADQYFKEENKKEAATYYNKIVKRFSGNANYTECVIGAREKIKQLAPDKINPKISVTSPSPSGNVIRFNKPTETVSIRIADESALKKVTVNGKEVSAKKSGDVYKVSETIDARQQNKINIVAIDDFNNEARISYRVQYENNQPVARRQTRKTYEKNTAFDFVPHADVDNNIPINDKTDRYSFALIIGNEDYTTYQTGLNSEINVDFARNDAYMFREYARDILGVPEKNIIFLTDATSGVMSQKISKFLKLMEITSGKGTFYFYYAGHGLPHEKTKEPYLIPADINGRNLNGAVSLNKLYNDMAKYDAKRITVFIDACFSGGARNNPLLAARGVKIVPKSSVLKGPLVVYTASSSDQSSMPHKEKKHGMFTYFLLKKLKETAGNITYKELADYLKESVGIESLMINDKEQVPFIGVGPAIKNEWKYWKFVK